MATQYPVTVTTDAPIIPDVPLSPIAIVRTDDLPDLVFTVQDVNGVNVNLTGASSTFRIRLAGMSTTTNDANNTCTVNVPNATCTYDLISTDFPRIGLYEGELDITFAGPATQTIYKLIYMQVRAPV